MHTLCIFWRSCLPPSLPYCSLISLTCERGCGAEPAQCTWRRWRAARDAHRYFGDGAGGGGGVRPCLFCGCGCDGRVGGDRSMGFADRGWGVGYVDTVCCSWWIDVCCMYWLCKGGLWRDTSCAVICESGVYVCGSCVRGGVVA